jgi:hypothetical protein
MLAEIILLRLDAALRAMQEAASATKSRFVPICPGMVFKPTRRHLKLVS